MVFDGAAEQVVDITDPTAPRVLSPELPRSDFAPLPYQTTIDRQSSWYQGTGEDTLTVGDLLVRSVAEPFAESSGRLRYFMDRIDFSDPARPTRLPAVNVPGTVLQLDPIAGTIVTLDVHNEVVPARDAAECEDLDARFWFDEAGGVCRRQRRSLNALILEGDRAVRTSRLLLDGDDRHVNSLAVSRDRLFYLTGGESPSVETLRIVEGAFQRLPSVAVERSALDRLSPFPRGERLLLAGASGLQVVDTSTPAEPRFAQLEGCNLSDVHGDLAYCTSGFSGAELRDLSMPSE